MSAGDRQTPPTDREPLPTCVNGLDELPAAFWSTLEEGLAQAGLTTTPLERSLSPENHAAVDVHVRLLLAWNAAINLTAIREPVAIAREHIVDSLAAVPLLRRAGVDEFLDIGSGAGFPGLPLGAALPARRALLVESVGKKARFLSVVADANGIADRVHVAATRAETLAADPRHRERWQVVVARAVTDGVELVELALPLLRPGGLLVAWKRLPLDDELARTERALRQLGGRIASVEPVHVAGLEDHVLAVVEKTAPTSGEFPRDPAARRRRPLGGAGGGVGGPGERARTP